jgi:hypothetical protein
MIASLELERAMRGTGRGHASAVPASGSARQVSGILYAATLLAQLPGQGRAFDSRALRSATEAAFGSTDAEGGWMWEDACEALEGSDTIERSSLRLAAPIGLSALADGGAWSGSAPTGSGNEAKLWELCAVASLARLRHDRARRAEARNLLAPVTAGLPKASKRRRRCSKNRHERVITD